MTEKEALKIRKNNRNPDVTFAHPDVKYKRVLDGDYTYEDAVTDFENKVTRWYFGVAEKIEDVNSSEEGLPGANFSVLMLNCMIIDLLSQYYYGMPTSKGSKFKSFVETRFSKYNKSIDPPIRSCSYMKCWKVEGIKTIADALWHGFRCGVLHSGRILEYGRINELYDTPISIEPWESNPDKKDIHINTFSLLKEIKKVFKSYMKDLKSNREPQKRNFIKKFQFDYGVKLKNKKG
jgi:hypothetical protein